MSCTIFLQLLLTGVCLITG